MTQSPFFLVCITIVSLLFFSCESTVEPEQVVKHALNDFQLQIDRTSANIGDTVKIYGKQLGTVVNDVTVHLDTIAIRPVKVIDTCISFVISKNIPDREYSLSVSIRSEKVDTFAKLTIRPIGAVNHALYINKTIASYGDTIKIFGKQLGIDINDVTVYLDTIAIKPIQVIDTCITIIISKYIPERVYPVSVSLQGQKIDTIANLTIKSVDTENHDYSLNKTTASFGDTVKVFGKKFGYKINDVAVYLNTIAIIPIEVLDTCISFVISKNIPDQVYSVSLSIRGVKVETFTNLTIKQGSTINYNARLSTTIARCGDIVKISGKNFGPRISNVTVFLDGISITPAKVVDTCIWFTIPLNTPVRTYEVSATIITAPLKNIGSIYVIPEKGTLDYQLQLSTTKAERLDIVKVYGRHFLYGTNPIKVYLGNTLINPFNVNDSCVTFSIPEYMPKGIYDVSVLIENSLIENFAKLEIVVKKGWGDFTSCSVTSSVLPSNYTKKIKRNYQAIDDTTFTYPVKLNIYGNFPDSLFLKPTYKNNKLVYNFRSYRASPYQDGYKSANFKAEIDTLSKSLTNIFIRDSTFSHSKEKDTNGFYMSNLSTSYLEVGFAKYKEIENGIEILITAADLGKSIQGFGNLTLDAPDYLRSFSFKNISPYPNSPYGGDQYIKIVLLR